MLDDPLAVYDKLLKGLVEQQSAGQRNPKTVEQALSLIAAQRDKLARLGEQLGDLGDEEYWTPTIIKARQAGSNVVSSSIEFYGQAERCLRVDAVDKQRQEALLKQRQQVDQCVGTWKECWEDFRRSYQRLQGIGQ